MAACSGCVRRSRPHLSAACPPCRPDYSNWELSADRANAARRLMQTLGMREDQVSQVRGYADQNPRDPATPDDPKNRRVTMIILNTPAQTPSPATTPPAYQKPKP